MTPRSLSKILKNGIDIFSAGTRFFRGRLMTLRSLSKILKNLSQTLRGARRPCEEPRPYSDRILAQGWRGARGGTLTGRRIY